MPMDLSPFLGAVSRSVSSCERDGQAVNAVTLERTFHSTQDALWDALTNPDSIPKWFLPLSGDLKTGGRYQLEGNAGGLITACQPTSHFSVTWEFGGDTSWVDVSLKDPGDGVVGFSMTHSSVPSEHWHTYGPGATGVGWEMGLMGLALYLAGEPMIEESAFGTVEGKAFLSKSAAFWGQAAVDAGGDAESARAAAARTAAFYTGA